MNVRLWSCSPGASKICAKPRCSRYPSSLFTNGRFESSHPTGHPGVGTAIAIPGDQSVMRMLSQPSTNTGAAGRGKRCCYGTEHVALQRDREAPPRRTKVASQRERARAPFLVLTWRRLVRLHHGVRDELDRLGLGATVVNETKDWLLVGRKEHLFGVPNTNAATRTTTPHHRHRGTNGQKRERGTKHERQVREQGLRLGPVV